MNLLWDLDGTLTDPQVGIIKCIQYALEKFGAPVPAFEELRWCIGPPLYVSFPKLVPGLSETQVHELVALYRERFSNVGMLENALIPGIPELLASLKAHRHFVATSKPTVYAEKIVAHYGIDSHFEQVYGSELSGVRSHKNELLAHLLLCEQLDPAECLMIGDREHDALGARANGIRCAGVLWGYGSREELERAGVVAVLETPLELKAFVSQ